MGAPLQTLKRTECRAAPDLVVHIPPKATMQQTQTIDGPLQLRIPTMRQLVRRALPQWIEGAIVPLGVFWIALHFLGLTVAVAAGLGCCAATMTWRLATKRQVHGMLIVGALALLARSILAMLTGSTFLYFLQPIIGTAFIATAFLVSVWIQRPLAQRFASDFCDIPTHLYEERKVHQYFQRCSLMWAAVSVLNTGITLWLLTSQPVDVYLFAKTLVTIVFNVGAVIVSVMWFKRIVIRHALHDLTPMRAEQLVAVPVNA